MRSCARAGGGGGGGGGGEGANYLPAPCLQYGDISMLSAKEGFAFIEYTDPNAATVRALSPLPFTAGLFARTPSRPSLLATHRPPPTRGRTPSAGCTTLR